MGARLDGDGDRAVVRLWGEHDLLTSDGVARVLQEAVASERDVIIDLSAVSFMDASILRPIACAEQRLRVASRSLQLVAPSELVVRMLRACELDARVVPMEGSLED